jgi:hypothetical protein
VLERSRETKLTGIEMNEPRRERGVRVGANKRERERERERELRVRRRID